MSDIQVKPVRFKKRYVAIAALAGLVATGGIVGATVTKNSTIAENKITVTEVPPAVVTASGTPMSATWKQGTTPAAVPGKPANQIGHTTYKLTNSSATDATVKLELLDVNLELLPGASPSVNGTFHAGAFKADGTQIDSTFFAQRIAAGSGQQGITPTSRSFTLPANSEATVNAYISFGNGWSQVAATSKSFDVKFNFVNKE